MKKNYYVNIMGIGIPVDKMEYDPKYNTVWLYLNDMLLTGIALRRYNIRYNFTNDDGLRFYRIFKK